MVEHAVGVGIVLNLVFYEWFGLSAGGMVVPGYFALFFDAPTRIAGTLLVAVATWLLVARALSRVAILYGRRRHGLMLLVGMVLTDALGRLAPALVATGQDWRAIGVIVPGLLANEMERQGVWQTLAVTLLLAGATRLVLSPWLGRVWP